MAGYARDPGSSPVANRRRAYIVVTVLALIIALPLAANSFLSIALARWAVTIQRRAIDLAEGRERRARLRRGVERADRDPGCHDRRRLRAADRRPAATRSSTAIPSYVGVVIDVGQGVEHVVQ